MAQPTPEETTSLLNRLAQKPGVTSTLILSRTNGAVVRASGLISAAQPDPDGTTTQDIASTAPSVNGNGAENGDREQRGGKSVGLKSAQDVAKLVWRLFGGAGEVVDDMMGVEDEVRLLRLRTKRNEIVIVPDANFLLVVIHDTPPA